MEISVQMFEEFIKDSVKLDLVKKYVETNDYINKDILLILLGESNEIEENYLKKRICSLECDNDLMNSKNEILRVELADLRLENERLRGKE